MGGSPEGFDYRLDRSGEVRITHHGRSVTTLRGGAVARFLHDVESRDPQQVMARATGNFKRGNERTAEQHPRNRRRPG